MKVIKTIGDVRRLEADPDVPKAVSDHLEERFYRPYECLGSGQSVDEFSLDIHGYMVLLEEGDTVLSELRKRRNTNDLLVSPECVELHDIGDREMYEVAFLLDNDYVLTYFVEASKSDSPTERWLREESERSACLNLRRGD